MRYYRKSNRENLFVYPQKAKAIVLANIKTDDISADWF